MFGCKGVVSADNWFHLLFRAEVRSSAEMFYDEAVVIIELSWRCKKFFNT